MEADFSGVTVEAPPDARGAIARFVEALDKAEKAVEDAEKALTDRKRERDKIAQTDLPEAMKAAGGLVETTLDNGIKVTIKDDVKVSTSEEKRPALHQWLRDHKHDGIIKSILVIDVVGLSEVKQARIAKAALSVGAEPERKDAVHPQTLQSLIRELLANAKPVPPDTAITIYPFKQAIIKKSRVQING